MKLQREKCWCANWISWLLIRAGGTSEKMPFFYAQIFDSSFTPLLILLDKLLKRGILMKPDNNSSIIAICSALNALFLIGFVAMDRQWDNLPSWIVYPYILLMVINVVILLVYAAKNNKK